MTACPALLIAAPSSGSGKTSVTAALARHHARAGRRVRIFKLGPDFLDPMVLAAASGTRVDNVDAWMVGISESRRLLHAAAADADLILVEGAMGLFDGDPAPADLAVALGLPVAVVIDAGAMAQTFGAVALGMQAYRPQLEIAGFIANKVAGPGHAAMLASSLPPGVALLATIGTAAVALRERHLGLVPPSELGAALDAALDSLADAVDLRGDGLPRAVELTSPPAAPPPLLLRNRTIAMARDAAFCFVYGANLDCLTAMGARIVAFSPLADEPVPSGADAVYLPGGYPELHAAALSRATRWQASLRGVAGRGVPVWAECGGMMACFDALVDAGGVRHPMAGLFRGEVVMHARVMGIGLHSLRVPGVEEALRGHTFHVSTVDGHNGTAPMWATVPHGPYGAPEVVHTSGSLTASYFHAWFPSSPEAAAALFLPRP